MIDTPIKGAWAVKNKWDQQFIEKYRKYIGSRALHYHQKITRTCEDFSLSLLFDFARENALPVKIQNGTGIYYAELYEHTKYKYKPFETQVLTTTGASDLENDFNAIFLAERNDINLAITAKTVQPGDLFLIRKRISRAHHIQMITDISTKKLVVEIYQGTSGAGNTVPGASRFLSAGDPDSFSYTGVLVQRGSINLLSNRYFNEDTKLDEVDFFNTNNIESRTWNFLNWN